MVTVVPILPSLDFDETVAFYERLGFREHGRWPDEYLIIARPGGLELHFWMNKDLEPSKNADGCYIRCGTCAETKALYAEWQQLGLPPGGSQQIPCLNAPYPNHEFALLDVHGNLVRVGCEFQPPNYAELTPDPDSSN